MFLHKVILRFHTGTPIELKVPNLIEYQNSLSNGQDATLGSPYFPTESEHQCRFAYESIFSVFSMVFLMNS